MRITPISDKKAENGEWFEYLGVPLLIARSNSRTFKKTFRRLSKPYERQLRNNRLDPETSEKLVCRAMAEAVLLGWDESKMPGNVPYSIDNAESLLLSDTDCREFVSDIAQEAENFFITDEEEKVGKSSTPSNGKSNTAS